MLDGNLTLFTHLSPQLKFCWWAYFWRPMDSCRKQRGLLGGLPIVGGIAGGDPISAILGLVTQLLQTVLGLLGGAGGITNALPIGNIGNIASGATGALPIGNIGKIAGGAVPSI
ncbi:hypothetical protein QR680_016323 [Steinernema hermaphroditum]|uniref:Uncharacterized protein n=1 Tax=Steinernema hermaphroditum TaxID=289476 RepID=A0AA39HB50_9BILA|nr:hypothetical protein QR680_016323 [Steinernema hermaphroditum]